MNIGRQNPEGRKTARPDVGNRHAHFGRRPARKAGNGHQPAHPLRHQVKAAPTAIRPRAAKPGNAGVNEPRVDFRQRRVTQPQPFHHAGPEILHHNVRGFAQPPEHRLPRRGAQIQGDAAFVAIERQEAGREPAADPGTHPPRVVAAAGPLNLDYISPHIRQQ